NAGDCLGESKFISRDDRLSRGTHNDIGHTRRQVAGQEICFDLLCRGLVLLDLEEFDLVDGVDVVDLVFVWVRWMHQTDRRRLGCWFERGFWLGLSPPGRRAKRGARLCL